MNGTQLKLIRACTELDLNVVIPFELTLGSNQKVVALALIEYLMCPNGALVFNSYEQMEENDQAIIDMNFGYTVYGDSDENEFDLESYIDMFSEWGWSGPNELKPDWMKKWEEREDEISADRFRWLVEAIRWLASPPEMQLSELPEFAYRPYDIALTFIDIYVDFSHFIDEQWKGAKYVHIIDEILYSHCASEYDEFWESNAVATDKVWALIRKVAKQILIKNGLELRPPELN